MLVVPSKVLSPSFSLTEEHFTLAIAIRQVFFTILLMTEENWMGEFQYSKYNLSNLQRSTIRLWFHRDKYVYPLPH